MATKIHTLARLRPLLPHEQHNHDSGITADESANSICVVNPRDDAEVWKFPFSSVYAPESPTESIYQKDVKYRVSKVFEGITLTIFAYGVTSSGKTYTMQGNGKGDEGGLTGLVVDELFNKTEMTKITMQYMEIYKDDIYDLLIPRSRASKLSIRTSPSNEIVVPELTVTQPLSSPAALKDIFTKAATQRAVGSTNLNHESSRSHSILILRVETRRPDGGSNIGRINLVDLAGSENNKMTGANKERLSESSAINKSLTVLGMVVEAINRGDSRVPYRDSKLTRILQDALGGGSLSVLILNLPPAAKMRSDALNSIHFATRTKNIENRVVSNCLPPPPQPKPAGGHNRRHSLIPAPASRLSLPNTHQGGGRRASLLPLPKNPASGYGPTGMLDWVVQPRVASGPLGLGINDGKSVGNGGMSKEEIDEVVKKMVEEEVGRRLAVAPASTSEEHENATGEGRIWGSGGGSGAVGSLEPIGESSREVEDEDREDIMHDHDEETHPPSNESNEHNDEKQKEKEEKEMEKQEMMKMNEQMRMRLEELEGRIERAERQTSTSIEQAPTVPEVIISEPEPEQDVVMTSITPATPSKATSSIADMLSPVARKKAGRAYVQLARTHCAKGDLRTSLDLYRKAEVYVPKNDRLRERILDIEYAYRTGKPFTVSPPKKDRKRRRDEDREKDGEGRRKKERRT